MCSPRRIAQLFVGSEPGAGGSLKLSQQLPILQLSSAAWPPAIWVDRKPMDSRFSVAHGRPRGWELEHPRRSVWERLGAAIAPGSHSALNTAGNEISYPRQTDER